MENKAKNTFSFGEFELDANRRLLLKQGKAINLNPKALELLLTLVENHGRVMSKNDLLDKVWENQFVEENNLTVHIAALRKALGEKKNENRYILTVPGKGYNFVAKVQAAGFEEIPSAENQERFSDETVYSKDTSASNRFAAPNNGQDYLASIKSNGFYFETLIGREREIAEIKNLLRGESANLITMTGAGGTGKTRLARAVAGELEIEFPEGVFFIELAAVSDSQLVIPVIAQMLGVKETGGKTLFENLKYFLHERRTLLILDNFEQLISAASLIKELADRAPLLKILVTSRTALRVIGELEFSVMPLAVPPRGATFAIEELNQFASIALFLRRARAAKQNFIFDETNAPVIAEICHKLDGLPLAIELAAARVKLLAPQSILDRLENSLKLLTGGSKDLSPRQQTMRGAIKWSYDLLDENEKVLFRRLAVFAGGFTVEAAETVCDEHLPGNNDKPAEEQRLKTKPETEILDLITSLVDNNLLVQIEQPVCNPRLRTLEVVREYAGECLEESGEENALRQKHAEFFLTLAEKAETYLMGEQSVDWLKKLEVENDNLRDALGWSLRNDPEIATRMAAALRYFWIFLSYLTEGSGWLRAALEQSASATPDNRFKMYCGQGILARVLGDYKTAQDAYQKALDEGRKTGNRQQIAKAVSGLGTVLQLKGDFEAARKCYEEGLEISRELKDEHGIAYALICLGIYERTNNNPAQARRFLEESLAILRKFGNKEAISNNLNNLGSAAFEASDFKAAERYFTEGLEMSVEIGNKINTTDFLNGFAALAVQRHNLEQATQLAGAAENLKQSVGYDSEPTERRFREAYIAQIRNSLDERTFAEAYERGQILNLNEAVALAQLQPKNGVNGNQSSDNYSEFDAASEIIIENHRFSRVIIEEETVENDTPYKTIAADMPKQKTFVNTTGFLPKIIFLSLGIALLTALLAFWFWSGASSANSIQYNLIKLTTSGKVTNATLTPDSKYAVFSQTENDGESLWLRHIPTGSQKQILPTKPVKFVGLAVSPEGNTIYCTIFSPTLSNPQIWRVPLLGGSTEEIKGITTGAAVSFSPAGDKMAFIESRSSIDENHLLVAYADGTNKKILARAKGNSRSFSNFNANPVAWSPDGSEIACAVDEKNSEGIMKAGIILFNSADGSEKFVSDRRWDYIEHLTWIDSESLAFVAYTSEPWRGQIWKVSRKNGETEQITKDLNTYSWLASAGGNLLTVQKNAVSYVSAVDFDEKNNEIEPREVFKESGYIENAVWTADGSILYSSSANGKREIWRVEADGTNPTQLTVGANVTFGISVSPADGSLVFGSSEGGRHFLKLADVNGKNTRILTEGAEDVYPNFTADGQTVIFQRGLKDKLVTLWRVSLNDKNPVQITRSHGTHPTISPDGTQAAQYFMDAETDNLWRIRLVSTADGAFFNKLSFPKAVTERRMRWHPGGRFIGQIFYVGENIKLLLLPTDGSASQVISGFGKGDVNWFDWSRDGRQIAFSHTTETQDAVFLSKH